MNMVSLDISKRSIGLDSVNVSFLRDEGTQAGKKPFPLVITPRWESSLSFLTTWMEANRAWLDERLLQYGAVLIRGFEIDSGADMQKAMRSFQPKLNNTYRGTSPRNLIPGTEYIFSAAEVPVNYPIAQHLEMSFLPAPPKQLFFGCLQPSQSTGGETALADFRKVYQDLPCDLRQKLLEKGVRYTRTHYKQGARFTYDVASMLSWSELFGTSDKATVERMCAAEGTPVQWTGDDTFVSITQASPYQLHPVTKEPVWFNHIQVFHWTTFTAELWFSWKRTRDWRLLIHCFFVTCFCLIKYGMLGHRMSLHSTFGDGEEISVAEMNKIRHAIHRNMVFSRWEKGDVMLIDNFSTSHGRQPTYDKGRKIVVAWADPMVKTNEFVTNTTAVAIQNEARIVVNESEFVHMENPQERTPPSTLTKEESDVLQEQLSTKNSILQNYGGMNPQDEIFESTILVMKRIVAEAERKSHKKSFSQPSLMHLSQVWES
ncbi:predicted protein [Phaeodactylum tricornutum CCAP 1055/1]|uniref:TauD/TfdA-like domain-containing protein n=1 Tax=Phaeodactylum tricornutum (strain CCAP 1055/1) TaxID=556484 RepID=B7FZP7_PHATC|nr:predicted protein [Phaeodactylum tricornutum CCAP 1055/1]EEC48375.1 predicted protein [Phaeodactylum tricornutum CCAP 1055/1]|eukprot:XP_002180184.1 predicted protein [Phaeodactylum tricornutum CCAP 1055/1]